MNTHLYSCLQDNPKTLHRQHQLGKEHNANSILNLLGKWLAGHREIAVKPQGFLVSHMGTGLKLRRPMKVLGRRFQQKL